MTERIGIIKYGSGNILSVSRAFEAVGMGVEIIEEPSRLKEFSTVVLPGVGAFKDAMRKLDNLGFTDALMDFKTRGEKLIGICLGMQLLFNESHEFGLSKGLGFIDGAIHSIQQAENFDLSKKIPNINWLPLVDRAEALPSETSNQDFYFVHSFYAVPTDPKITLAEANYAGVSIPAIVKSENLIGFQFHPEKSRDAGLNLLRLSADGTL